MTTFWMIWVFALTATCLGLVLWVLLANRKVALKDDGDPENKTTGHVYDGIEEYDNPLPKWWFQLFVGSIVFAIGYLIWYPGVWSGIGGWSSAGELKANQDYAEENYGESYRKFSKMSVEDLIHDNGAMKMGARLFSSNCSVCHGADGGGNFGIPNLTDMDSLYGRTPEMIKATLYNGRNGYMPAWGAVLGEKKINHVAEFVLKLSAQDHDAAEAALGEEVFASNCSTCHGPQGKGIQALGAPNLTDDIWLYDGSKNAIVHALRNGLSNHMPAQKELLRDEKIHVLAAYVYSLSYNYEE